MDYSKILKIDENTTIVDVIGIYEVFLKRIGKKKKPKDTDINEINALNIALMMACNFKSDNELINKKNAYLLKNRVWGVIKNLNKTIKDISTYENSGFGTLFAHLKKMLENYLIDYNRLVNYLRKTRNIEEYQSIIDKFEFCDFKVLLISHLNDFVYDHMMSCLTYTREYEAFTWGLMQTKDFYEEIVFLNKNISFIKTIEDANEILVNNVLYKNLESSKLSEEDALILSKEIKKMLTNDVICNHLTISELVSKYNHEMIARKRIQIIKSLGLGNKRL